jgi:hypothetical protein
VQDKIEIIEVWRQGTPELSFISETGRVIWVNPNLVQLWGESPFFLVLRRWQALRWRAGV